MIDEGRVLMRRADPSALGLADFAVTTFLASLYNIVGGAIMPLAAFFVLALCFGGLAEFVAGLFEYGRENTFGATVYTSYGALYLALAGFGWLVLEGHIAGAAIRLGLAWIVLAYAAMNLTFLLESMWINRIVSLVFLAIEATEILLVIGYFSGEMAGTGLVAIAGGVGILTALLAWYASGAALVNGMAGTTVLPVGEPAARHITEETIPSFRRHAA